MNSSQNSNTNLTPQQFLLHGEPVCALTGNEFLKVEGKTFVQQVEDFFIAQGGIAHSAFGEVIHDKKGIQNSKQHGMSRIKASSFAGIKSVLENGIIILPMQYWGTNSKKELTGMIAAPIQIASEKYICVVEIIANAILQRLYVHETFITKNLQEVAASNPVHGSVTTTSPQHQGEVAKVLQKFFFKGMMKNNS